MMNFYISNYVRVSWCGYFSEYFLATNGVKLGDVLSPILYCVYLDELLLALSAAKVGCYVGESGARWPLGQDGLNACN